MPQEKHKQDKRQMMNTIDVMQMKYRSPLYMIYFQEIL